MAYPTLMAPLIKVERQKVYDPDTMMWVAMEQPSVGPISGSVTVVNMIPPVETGLAKEATLSTLTTPSDQQHVIVDSSAAIAVTGPLTDTQLRASSVPVSAAVLPLPSGAATESTLELVLTASDFDGKTGSVTETAPVTDTASSGLNGRLQRIAQRLTSLITALGTPFQAGGSIGNTAFALNAGTALIGSVYDEPDDTWHQTHVPATNTQATITQASAGNGLKNVVTGFTATICAGATVPTAIQLTVALIDGATGGTTYLWRTLISLPAAAGAIVAFHSPKGKWTGSAATATTIEFSVAGGANTFESVTMKGYTKA